MLSSNERKNLVIETGIGEYERYAIKTHFVQVGENFADIIEKYVMPHYKEGDIVSCSEKIVALCQERIIHRRDMKISFWAKFLSKFASHPSHGIGVGEAIKMQFAIDQVGLLKVLWAAFASAVTKLFGKKGVFYEIVGMEVSGLDGFYDHVWEEYRDIGILIPENPAKVCDEMNEKFGIDMMIVDANDYGQELLGKGSSLNKIEDKHLLEMIKDNPAGQGRECTPIILIRKKA
ncbi:MAG: F420-0--gamma-glutamyl ligase [Ruminococcaceae bacterium]|nr:F420-0--gamma-glutamyl ligase [Oscillospiraceae bacterium]